MEQLGPLLLLFVDHAIQRQLFTNSKSKSKQAPASDQVIARDNLDGCLGMISEVIVQVTCATPRKGRSLSVKQCWTARLNDPIRGVAVGAAYSYPVPN